MRTLFFIPLAMFAMTLEEKVGQLFVAPICPKYESEEHFRDWESLIDQYHIGSAIIYGTSAENQIRFLNRLGRPLFVMQDLEWGLTMRIPEAPVFPKNMALGAIQDLSLIERMGEEIAREAKLIGVHMNIAPVVDVNNNPKNPIIHMRSFGDNPEEVVKRSNAMIRGMHRGGLLTCIKHFPGHGDTEIDSHLALPTIPHGKDRLDSIELVPFKNVSSDAVMSAHILIPSIDSVPATLSYPIMTGILRDEIGFGGLIITDALNMHALDNHSVEEVALAAHAAGADLLLYGDCELEETNYIIREMIPRAYKAILKAYQDGTFPISRLDRIIEKKSFVPLAENPSLMTPETEELRKEIYEAIITHVGNDFEPIDPDTAYLSIGDDDQMIEIFCPCACREWGEHQDLDEYERVVIALRNLKPREENYGLTPDQISFFHDLSSKVELAFCIFGTPYALSLLPPNAAYFIGYEPAAQQAMISVITGERIPTGKLPIEIQH